MQNNKIFKLENKEDFHFYLLQLITRVSLRLRRYKRYLDELDKIIVDNKITPDVNIALPVHYYEDMCDKIMHTEKTLLNLFGDLNPSSVSYYKFRNLLDRKIKANNPEFDGIGFLEDEFKTYLKEMNLRRNWGLHMPESMVVATYERLKEDSYPLPVIMVKSPIRLVCVESYDSQFLWSLYESSNMYYDMMQKLFQRMKKDYSKIIGESVRIEVHYETSPYPFNAPDVEIANTSWLIQTGKLKEKKK